MDKSGLRVAHKEEAIRREHTDGETLCVMPKWSMRTATDS